MTSSFRRMLIKLGVFFVVAVLITLSVVATLLDLKSIGFGPLSIGQSQSDYHAVFDNATGLEKGDTVRIAGVEVGKVNGVSLTRDHKAMVNFSVASDQHVTRASLASIQFENLLGQRYLQLSAGADGGTPLPHGATIPLSQTTDGLDLTTVFSGFQPLLAALNPAQVNELTGSIIAVLQGESGSVGNLVQQTATLTSNLAGRQNLIDQILDNLTPLLTNVNANDSQLAGLIDGLDNLVKGLAGEKNEIGGAVSGLSTLTTGASNLLQNVQPALDQDLSGLQNATGVLLNNQDQLNGVINNLPAFVNALDKVSSSGNYLSIYVCDLTLNVSGPVSVKLSPGVSQSPAITLPGGVIGDPTKHTKVCQ